MAVKDAGAPSRFVKFRESFLLRGEEDKGSLTPNVLLYINRADVSAQIFQESINWARYSHGRILPFPLAEDYCLSYLNLNTRGDAGVVRQVL